MGVYREVESGKEEEERERGVLLEAGGNDKTSTTKARRPGMFLKLTPPSAPTHPHH